MERSLAMERSVVIEAGPPCPRALARAEVAIVVDVIRSMTTAVTAAALGWRCLPVPSLEAARALARALPRALLAGEQRGEKPEEFELQNSPAAIAERTDRVERERPLVLLSTAGTRLLVEAASAGAVYPACLRNARAVAAHVAAHHRGRVTVLGAFTRGELREEDLLCCARIAGELERAGFSVADRETAAVIARWAHARPESLLVSESVGYLQKTGQLDDLDFILSHVDDLDAVFRLHAGELVREEAVHLQRAALR